MAQVTTSDFLGCRTCKFAKKESIVHHYCKLSTCVRREGIDCRTCPHFVEEISEAIDCSVNIMLPVMAVMAGECEERVV